MATITFKGKARACTYPDGAPAYRYIPVPTLKRIHCNMAEFRCHQRYGGYANSDLFPGMLRRIAETLFPAGYVRLDSIPAGVAVDESGFLAEVTIEV